MKRHLISSSCNRNGKSYNQIANLMSVIRQGKNFAVVVGGEIFVYEAKKCAKQKKQQKPTQYDFDLLSVDEMR